MNVFVVIAVHNRKKFTLDCLQFLKEQSYNDFNIVVVDDGSDDGTSDDINTYYPDVYVVKGDGSWWWTKSMNQGCNKAIELGADILITLNNDTYFDSQFIEQLVKLHKENSEAVLGCLNLIEKDKEYIFYSGLKDIHWWKAKEVKYHQAFTPYTNNLQGIHPTMCLNGRGTLIPVKIFKEVKGYDEENFPQYASDYDFTLRVKSKGYPCYISYSIKIYSFIENTGEGKSFIKQSWNSFLKSFNNPYSQTSLKMWHRYYRRHASVVAANVGFLIQILRTVIAFVRKRNVLKNLQ